MASQGGGAWLLTLLTVTLAVTTSTTRAMQVTSTFRDPGANPMQRVAVHEATGEVYVGATNRLHRLGPGLTLRESASTGPRNDNPDCPPPIIPCEQPKVPTNSETKALVIDYDEGSLIICSTLFHGFCQKVATGNITHVMQYANKPLVPNDHSSCVVTIGPGVEEGSKALYIAASYSDRGNARFRNLVPALSSRKLASMGDFVHRDDQGATKKSLREEFKTEATIIYETAFSHGGFVYFVSLQRESSNATDFVSRIGRICTRDKYFDSYVEVPLQCSSPTADFPAVRGAHYRDGKLFAVFSDTLPAPQQDEAKAPSALCSFDMADVDRVFNATVEACLQGRGSTGPAHFQPRQSCPKVDDASRDECGLSGQANDVVHSIEGKQPLSSDALLVIPDQVGQALLVQPHGRSHLVYIGTQSAMVLKSVVQGRQAREVARQQVDIRGPVLQMAMAKDQDHIYVLSPSKLSMVWTRHCELQTSCEDCMATGDALCGWCVMESRCKSAATCSASVVKPHWLPVSGRSCATITHVHPEVLSYETLSQQQPGQISFKLDRVNVQQQNVLDLKCSFVTNAGVHKTAAMLTNDVIKCPLPAQHQLPTLPPDHEKLELQFHVQGRSIVTRSVSVFDCRVHQNCSSCVRSQFACQWCFASSSCQKSGNTCPARGSIQPYSGITSMSACPRVETSSQDTDILVHSGGEKKIAVKVSNLRPEQKRNIKCHFSYLKESKIVSGSITSQNLVCETVKFAFSTADSPYVTASFEVTWGGDNYALDNPSGIQVRIYKCPLMVTNCGKCLSMDAEYECGWCGGECTLKDNCQGTWLDRTATCPDPQILRFSPTTGPVEGKTNISVTGINLGKTVADIAGGVTVSGLQCRVLPNHYQPSSGFTCEVEATASAKNGTISVTVDQTFRAQSDSPFYFVRPQVTDIFPKRGPRSGGTTVVIHGENINTGSERSVEIGGSPCEVLWVDATSLQCRTGARSGDVDEVDVELSFGGLQKLLPKKFLYVKDPAISNIEPKRSILKGGTTITVFGEGLTLIQKPKFFITYAGKNHTRDCELENPYTMQCPVPGILALNVTDTNPQEVHYGFYMDNVVSLTNISKDPQFGPLLYYPNPDIHQFKQENSVKKYHKDNMLAIKGRFRSINPLMSNVKVYVGTDECKNPAATDTAITCEPPPAPGGIDNQGRAMVELQIGNLRRQVGYLQYHEVSKAEKPIAVGVILGVVLPIIAIIVLLTICVVRRHRKHGPSDNYIPDVLKDYEGKKEEEEIGMNHVSVKADINGQLAEDKESDPYIAELLAKFEDPALRQSVLAVLIPSSYLEMGELIGKGNFGAVYKAQYQRAADQKPVQVAAKTLHAGGSKDEETVQAFLQEAVLLKDLQHPCLLSMVGVCLTPDHDPIVIMPFMATEDLKSYIREPSKSLTYVELLDFTMQVAEGMAYLESLHIVHRNLAARNCIITEDKNVRVTDYALTKSLFTKDYFFTEDSPAKLVLKWMAPETLENFEFSHKSDVWSFGVVTWEIMTRGVTPYPDVDSADLLAYLGSGKRMKKPRQSTETTYQLMLRCWAAEPGERPGFQQLEGEIRTLVQSDSGEESSESQPLRSAVDVGGSTEYLEVIG